MPVLQTILDEFDWVINSGIDQDIERRAADVPGRAGMTVCDAVRLLPTRTAEERMLPFAPGSNGRSGRASIQIIEIGK